MKFKVGDYVEILNGENIEDYAGTWTPGMAHRIGEVRKVAVIRKWGNKEAYTLDGLPYTFDGRGLKCAKHMGSISDMVVSVLVNREKEITTVKFADGDIKMVKCAEGVPFDEYFAVASALAEHVYGNNTQFKKAIKEYTHYVKPKKPKTHVPVTETITDIAETTRLAIEGINKHVKELEEMMKNGK